MAQWLRSHTAFPEDLSLFPNTLGDSQLPVPGDQIDFCESPHLYVHMHLCL